MSYTKLSLPASRGVGVRTRWPWICGGIVLLPAFFCIFVFFHGNSEDEVVSSGALNMRDLGAKEWTDQGALLRQAMEREVFDTDGDEALGKAPAESRTDANPFLIRGRITRNQTLFIALKNHGLDIGDIHQVIASLGGVVDFRKTKPGDRYEVHLDMDRRIVKFVYETSPEDISISTRSGNGYEGRKKPMVREVVRKQLSGTLNSTLYQAFEDLGESGELASHFMRLFKYDMDFSSQSQRGDQFTMLIDKVILNGEFYRYDRVWAATYESFGGKLLEAYYFDDADEAYRGYYDGEGRALKRTFLKNPVVGCPVSSPYNLKRMHPILKRIRPHYGIDWACPTGTPVMAFADGVVTYADWKGGNGNLLVIEHSHGYMSLYAHLYAFGRGIKKGARVKQGQVVGQVGTTGISTGSHLHFGVKHQGNYVDPSAISARRSYTLTGSRMAAFQARRNDLRVALGVDRKGKAASEADVAVGMK